MTGENWKVFSAFCEGDDCEIENDTCLKYNVKLEYDEKHRTYRKCVKCVTDNLGSY